MRAIIIIKWKARSIADSNPETFELRLIPNFISIGSTGHGARLSRTVLMSTSIVALGAVGALAQEAAPDPAADPPASVLRLDPVTVTATCGERPVDEVPGTVSVITDAEIDRRLVSSPRDLLRYGPGVSIGKDPSRSGLTNCTIRGIGGNRVLVQVDGARLPDFPATSPTFNRDYVDLHTVSRVEIVRGPASSLDGSDAIGGVVAYITKDPADYLAEFGRDVFASAKTAYDGADRSLSTAATLAGRAGKWVWNAGDHDTLKLTGERYWNPRMSPARAGLPRASNAMPNPAAPSRSMPS